MEVGLPFLNNSDPVTRCASVGTPQAGFQVQIRDAEGNQVREGEHGELFLKGPGMFDAYVAPWRTREEVTRPDGWFSTGDIATEDSGGFITIIGRSKTVINVGGMKFFPEEVELVLCSHPEVLEARVVGIPHPIFGWVPVAEVVKSPQGALTPYTLVSLCRKQLARYKLPVEIRFVETIPRTPSGKISRI
jgi:long-chain acyl-CoA synthetase